MPDGIGDRYQQETKYIVGKPLQSGPDLAVRPEPYKEYAGSGAVELPTPDFSGGLALDTILRTRRSVRRYSREPLTMQCLSNLLWASDGIQREERGRQFRTAPSAGALYPVETYLVVNRVAGVDPGVYHYGVVRHMLEPVRLGDFAAQCADAAYGQDMCVAASVVFIWTAVVERCRWRYGQRAYRYIYLDAGHIAQNLALAAVSMGLGSCQIAALYDDEVNRIVEVDGVEETVVYMTSVGHPAVA